MADVDELVHRRDVGQDPGQPSGYSLERPQDARGMPAADALEAVAAGDEVALKLAVGAVVRERIRGRWPELVDAHGLGPEERQPRLEARRDRS